MIRAASPVCDADDLELALSTWDLPIVIGMVCRPPSRQTTSLVTLPIVALAISRLRPRGRDHVLHRRPLE